MDEERQQLEALLEANKATLRVTMLKAARQGVNADTATQLEIEQAEGEIARIEAELDLIAEADKAVTAMLNKEEIENASMVALVLQLLHRVNGAEGAIQSNREAIRELHSRIFSSTKETLIEVAFYLVIVAAYTVFVVPESRDYFLANIVAGIIILSLCLVIALLLRLLKVFMPRQKNDVS